METIMYTNSKREGSNYQVDRMYTIPSLRVFSERMEVGQLIQNEMVRYNISHIHFWFVRDNIALIEDAKAETMLVALGRYVIQNKDSQFRFQYIVEKYQEMEEGAETQENGHGFKMDLGKSVEKDEKAARPNLEKRLIREEIIKEEIRFSHFKEFEIFIKKELRSNQDQEIIKKYLFQTQEQTIAISFFQSQQKELVHKIIDEDCNQIYNAKLHYRKISTIHPQDYEKNKKKKKQALEQPVQLYHRIVLFVYSTPDRIEDIRESKRKKTQKSNGPPAGTQALQAWRVKQEVESLGKYQKECELIKQEIQNEKLIFRNKIKVIQNYIGDTINVEKLYQEEEEIGTNSLTQQMNNTLTAPTFKKPTNLLKRSSVMSPAISQTITNNLQKYSKFNPANSFVPITEFKRLKDISQAMRNIDNTIFEQNKKIDQLKAKAKELKKLKEEVLFKNAKELNAIKREVLQLTREIQHKKEDIQEKKINGDFETLMKYKGREPSQAAKENLQEHIKFISQHYNGNQAKELQYEYQYMKEEEKSTHRSLHRRDSQEINTATAKFREKKMHEAMATALGKLKGKEEVQTEERNSIQMKASNMSNLLLECDNAKTTSSLTHLIELYRYYARNQQLISLVSKQIDHYKLINHSKTTHLSFSPSNLDLQEFPILQNALQIDSYDDLCQPVLKENATVHYKVESHLPRDCFDYFIHGDKRKPQSKDSSLRSSMRQETNKYTQPVVVPKVQPMTKHASQIWSKPSKFKRITIEEALHSNSLLKRVRMQE